MKLKANQSWREYQSQTVINEVLRYKNCEWFERYGEVIFTWKGEVVAGFSSAEAENAASRGYLKSFCEKMVSIVCDAVNEREEMQEATE